MDAFLLRDIIYATTSLINTEYEYKQVSTWGEPTMVNEIYPENGKDKTS